MGLLTASAISVLFCLAIRRTGALWWVIGFHAAWDWAGDFFFGSADSGSHALERLFTLLPHGNIYLSGGTDGPEGSVLCLAILVIGILALPALARRREGTCYSQDPRDAPTGSDGGLASELAGSQRPHQSSPPGRPAY